MLDQEFRSSRFELRITDSSQTLAERSIGGSRVGMSGSASIVERSKDTGRSFLFDQVANDLVVEVIDWSPLRNSRLDENRFERRSVRRELTLICSRTYSSCSVLRVS